MSSIALPQMAPPPARRGMSTWQAWGLILLAPYVLVFLAFVLYPVSYGLWLARHPESYVKLFNDPIFFRTIVNTIFFMFNPEWGVINSLIFRLTEMDGPNWLNDPYIGLSLAMLTHIWKSLPFWTLILISGRLAIPKEQYEAASVDGATVWQKFKFVTWPSIRTLYLTSTILSMIFTLGDFNSVYLLTGGGPADLTHVLATLGIR